MWESEMAVIMAVHSKSKPLFWERCGLIQFIGNPKGFINDQNFIKIKLIYLGSFLAKKEIDCQN